MSLCCIFAVVHRRQRYSTLVLYCNWYALWEDVKLTTKCIHNFKNIINRGEAALRPEIVTWCLRERAILIYISINVCYRLWSPFWPGFTPTTDTFENLFKCYFLRTILKKYHFDRPSKISRSTRGRKVWVHSQNRALPKVQFMHFRLSISCLDCSIVLDSWPVGLPHRLLPETNRLGALMHRKPISAVWRKHRPERSFNHAFVAQFLDSVGLFTCSGCSLLESDRLNEFDSLEDSVCFDSWPWV